MRAGCFAMHKGTPKFLKYPHGAARRINISHAETREITVFIRLLHAEFGNHVLLARFGHIKENL